MKSTLRILTIIISLILFSNMYTHANKTLLLESFVCNGTANQTVPIWHTDSIQILYPNDVILVRQHFDKDTFYDSWQSTRIDSLSISDISLFGFIATDTKMSLIGYLNRKKYKNNSGVYQFPVPRELYNYIDVGLNEPEKVSLSVDWSIDEEKKVLLAKVNAFMLETVEKPLRFNLYVVEDSVMGHGVGWDQNNSAISGNTGWLPCPYVYEPDTIPNFMHRHVVRKMLGGGFGVEGSFENPVTTGNIYTHDFQCDVDPRWDLNKLSVVGFVQVYDYENKDFEVLNAARGVYNDISFSVSSSMNDFIILDANESINKSYTLKNTSNSVKDFTYSIMKSDRTPGDWSLIEGTFESISLQPDESKEINFVLKRNGTSGIGDAILRIYEADNPFSLVWTEKMTIYSKETSHFHVTDEYGFMEYSLSTLLEEIGRNDIYEVSPEFLLENAQEFPDLKTIIWNTGYYLEAMDSVRISHLVQWNKEGINIFLGGNGGAIDHLYYYFEEYFGISLLAYISGANLTFTGFPDDPVSSFMADTTSFEPLPRNLSFIGINDSNIASKSLKMNYHGVAHYLIKDDWSTYDSVIASDNAVFGARIEKENARSFIMTKSFYMISDRDTAEILLNNIINWLDGISDVEDYEVNNDNFYLDVSPNPAYSHLNIKYAYDEILPEYVEIDMYDISGRKVKSVYQGIINSGEMQSIIDISDLPFGTYIVTLRNNNENLSCHVIVIR